MHKSELIEFIKAQKSDAEKDLKFREESVRVWSGGTDESWKKAGCQMNKAKRLETSAIHGRIAVKVRRRRELFDAVLNELVMGLG